MSLTPEEIEALAAQFGDDVGTLRAVVHGDAEAVVPTENGNVPSLAKQLADIRTGLSNGLAATSDSEITIGTGARAFQIAANKFFSAGHRALVQKSDDNTKWMLGSIVSYDGTTLTLTIDAVGGAGTFSDWTIGLSGLRGPQGIQGDSGASAFADISGAPTDNMALASALAAKATPADITSAINGLVAAAPGALDTLDELAAALGDDPNFAATIVTALAGKQASNANLAALSGLSLAADKMLYATGTGALALATLSAFARTLLDDADAAAMRATLGAASVSALVGTNILVNGDGRIDQMASGAGANVLDDAYGSSDMWYSLSQTAYTQVQRQINGANGVPFFQRLTQPQATAQRMGRAQIVSSSDSRKFRGGNVTFSGKLRFSVAQPVRYAVLSWSGTADVVTSDVVSDWTHGSYTAGGFFNATSLDVVAVGSVTPIAAAWADIAALTGTVPASCNNLIVLVWTEGTAATSVTLDFTAKLETGSIATPDVPRLEAQERQICEWFFQRLGGPAYAYFFLGLQNTTSTVEGFLAFPTKRIPPTLSISAAGDFQLLRAGPAADTVTALSLTNAFQNGCRAAVTVAGTPLTPGQTMIGRLGGSGGYIDIDARF